MKFNHKPLMLVLLLPVWNGAVFAQEKPVDASVTAPKATAQSEAGEPRAATSPAPAVTSSASPTAPSAVRPAARSAGSGQKASNAADRLDLNTATVTGDREQPKVMYIVPWKRSDMGDLSGKPMNSLLDEALAPVDRDEFKREVAYFDAVKAHVDAKADQKGEK